MYAKFAAFSIVGMSSSDPITPKVDDYEKRIQIGNPERRPELSSGSSSTDPPLRHRQLHLESEEENKDLPPVCESSSRSTVEACPSSPAKDHKTTPPLGGLSATAGEGDGCFSDDGFRTPTSSDQRISEIRPCPPAPRKPASHLRTRPVKRKNSPDDVWSTRSRRTPLLLDLSNEVESMFPPALRANLTCKIKKARSV